MIVQVGLDESRCVTLDLILNNFLDLLFKFIGHLPSSFALAALVTLMTWLEPGSVALEARKVHFPWGRDSFRHVEVGFLLLLLTNRIFSGLW